MMTEIKNEPLGSNCSNSSKTRTKKDYELWGKYKNNFLNAQEKLSKESKDWQGFDP